MQDKTEQIGRVENHEWFKKNDKSFFKTELESEVHEQGYFLTSQKGKGVAGKGYSIRKIEGGKITNASLCMEFGTKDDAAIAMYELIKQECIAEAANNQIKMMLETF